MSATAVRNMHLKCMVLLPLLVSVQFFASAVPSGFIAEVVTSQRAISGTFAPNPRNNWQPMLMLVSKEGQVSVVENPDDSPEAMVVLDLDGKMCTNTERGLQTIALHPKFEENLYVYLYYTKFKKDCLDDESDDGPWNVLERFVMSAKTLELDYDSREQIWR
jgi:Glucose / Sorbosone dehydrogenase